MGQSVLSLRRCFRAVLPTFWLLLTAVDQSSTSTTPDCDREISINTSSWTPVPTVTIGGFNESHQVQFSEDFVWSANLSQLFESSSTLVVTFKGCSHSVEYEGVDIVDDGLIEISTCNTTLQQLSLNLSSISAPSCAEGGNSATIELSTPFTGTACH